MRMGCGASTEESKTTAAIDAGINSDRKKFNSEIKILLLGMYS
jgi:hypothetical protein